MKSKLLIILISFIGLRIQGQARYYFAVKASDWTIPANTKEMIVEIWGAGASGNIFGGGNAGDYLLKKIKVNSEMIITNIKVGEGGKGNIDNGLDGGDSFITYKENKNGSSLELRAYGGKTKSNFIGDTYTVDDNYPNLFDEYYKGSVGHSNCIESISIVSDSIDEKICHISDKGGDGGESYRNVSTSGKGGAFFGTISKPKFALDWRTKNIISYSNPSNGVTPGGGGGGNSKYFVSSGYRFGSGGNGLIKITFIQ